MGNFKGKYIKIAILILVIYITINIYSAEGEYIMSRLGYDARSTGMGETGYLYNNSVSVMKVNPAGLGMIEGSEVAWTRTDFGSGAWHDCVNAGSLLELDCFHLGIGLNWNKLWVRGLEDIPETTLDRHSIAIQIEKDWPVSYQLEEIALGLGIKNDFLSGGFLVKYTSGYIKREDELFWGFGFDGGVSFIKNINEYNFDNVSLAIAVKDIGKTELNWRKSPDQYVNRIIDIELGCQIQKHLIETLLEFDSLGLKRAKYKVGGELNLKPVFIRMGYNGYALTAGLGIDIRSLIINFSVALESLGLTTSKLTIGYKI